MLDGAKADKIVVLKIGGSVLVDNDSYRRVARFVLDRRQKCSRESLVVVVSAQKGHTDELEALAREVSQRPGPRTLDLLWSTGEIRSVALLTLHLEMLGVAAVGLNVHEAGLRLHSAPTVDDSVEAFAMGMWRTLDFYKVVVVPGFFATMSSGTIVSLGRGGSDLSAVLLASELGAEACELIKDVGGYFAEDPKVHSGAQQLPSLSYEQALEMAEAGCDLVQPRALTAARTAEVLLVVRSLEDRAARTVVSRHGTGGPSESAALYYKHQ